MAQLRFFYGPMDCGKSTLALQMEYNLSRQGRTTLLLTCLDRGGAAVVSSRIGLSKDAVEVCSGADLFELVRPLAAAGPVAVVADEAQFYSPAQVEQLARAVDELGVDVFCYGIATDFRSVLFPGAQRLFELADDRVLLQVETYCWCGSPGRQQARVAGGVVVRSGDQVLVGDTDDAAVSYRVLCRKHFFAGLLAPPS